MKSIIIFLLASLAISAQTQEEFNPNPEFGEASALDREEQFLQEEEMLQQQEGFEASEFNEADEQYLEDAQLDPEREQLQEDFPQEQLDDFSDRNEQEFFDNEFENDPGSFESEADNSEF